MISIVAFDISKLTNQLMGLLIWVTPVIYSSKFDNALVQEIIKWNPLTYLIGALRDIILLGRIDSIDIYIIISLLSLLIFSITLRLFYLTEKRLIERILV
jgi:lipopolysaccharide transport system permease protein